MITIVTNYRIKSQMHNPNMKKFILLLTLFTGFNALAANTEPHHSIDATILNVRQEPSH